MRALFSIVCLGLQIVRIFEGFYTSTDHSPASICYTYRMNTKHIPLRPGGFKLTEIAASKSALTKDSNGLDIGCGTGASLEYIMKHYGCHVFGVDCSEKAISIAKTRFVNATDSDPNAPHLLTADASALPHPDNSFDLVMMECTLTLFDDPAQALKEATRVLKPEGMLFISALTQRKQSDKTLHTADARSNLASPELVKSGLLHADNLTNLLSELGFHQISHTERNDVLVQFVADAIFTYGSLDHYIKEASACIDGCVLNCNISPKEAGYSYFLATKH